MGQVEDRSLKRFCGLALGHSPRSYDRKGMGKRMSVTTNFIQRAHKRSMRLIGPSP